MSEIMGGGEATTLELWALDKGVLRCLHVVQDPEQPLRLYIDGLRVYPPDEIPMEAA